MKIPNATHSWKLITRPPRITAGTVSEVIIGIVVILTPIPTIQWSKYLEFNMDGKWLTKSHEETAKQKAPPILSKALCKYGEDTATRPSEITALEDHEGAALQQTAQENNTSAS